MSKSLERKRRGRPPFYDSPEALQEGVDAYFKECEANEKAPTMAGLALFLGFSHRDGLLHYRRKSEDFAFVVERAKSIMEDDRNQRLLSAKGNVAGLIFDLKNNFGWKDLHEQTIDVTAIDMTKLSDDQLEYIAKTGRLPDNIGPR